MEPHEAPERIYFSTSASHPFYGLTRKWLDDDIEYVRLDAFVDKAVEWLEAHKGAIETEDSSIMGWIPDYFIENFKNYMKGE